MLNDSKDLWLNSDWTREARMLINSIEKFPEDSTLIMFLRHSHRESIGDVQEMTNLGLTEEGIEIAKIFGKKLPLNKQIRLYFSAIPRCKDTAEYILEGFSQAGGKGQLKGPLKPLYSVDGDAQFIVKQIFANPEKELINRWAAGHFPPEKFQPLHIYSKKTAKKVFNIAKDAPRNHVDIYVTHDLQIMALRFSWFGLDPGNYWVSYLGGFIFSKNNKGTKILSNGAIIKIKTPHWWMDL